MTTVQLWVNAIICMAAMLALGGMFVLIVRRLMPTRGYVTPTPNYLGVVHVANDDQRRAVVEVLRREAHTFRHYAKNSYALSYQNTAQTFDDLANLVERIEGDVALIGVK